MGEGDGRCPPKKKADRPRRERTHAPNQNTARKEQERNGKRKRAEKTKRRSPHEKSRRRTQSRRKSAPRIEAQTNASPTAPPMGRPPSGSAPGGKQPQGRARPCGSKPGPGRGWERKMAEPDPLVHCCRLSRIDSILKILRAAPGRAARQQQKSAKPGRFGPTHPRPPFPIRPEETQTLQLKTPGPPSSGALRAPRGKTTTGRRIIALAKPNLIVWANRIRPNSVCALG